MTALYVHRGVRGLDGVRQGVKESAGIYGASAEALNQAQPVKECTQNHRHSRAGGNPEQKERGLHRRREILHFVQNDASDRSA